MPKTLLLADDSVTIQKVVGISFASEDIVLLTVDNGDDAIARAREARPDLVLADVLMPGRDGYEVCEAIKSDPELRHVPVLLLSGTFEPFDEERAQRAGADGHITKPFEAQALVDRVNELLARSASAEAAATTGDATVLVEPPEPPDTDDAFDFFDEEMAQTAPSPPTETTTAVEAPDVDAQGAPLELEAAVEDDEISDGGIAPHGADPQATVAILDDEVREPAAAEVGEAVPFFGEDFDEASLASSAATGGSSPRPANAPAGYEESFDFGFEERAAEPVAANAPELATRPAGGAMPAEDEALLTGDAETMPPALAEPEPEPIAAPEAAGDDLFGGEIGVPLEAEAEAEAEGEPEPEPLLSMAAPETAMPPPVPSAIGAPAAMPAPPPVPPGVAALSTPPVLSPELSEAVRRQLGETLEKMAWEAFGDLSERIVRDAVERVEAVAWEVIPQMAEALIREEIRRLKGEDD